MKKFFLFAAAVVAAMTINAQVEYDQELAFGEEDAAAAGEWSNGKTWEGDLFDLTINDENQKASIDANQAYFGTAESYKDYAYRLKTGGKSTATNGYNFVINSYEKGTLFIMVRTGSNSATDRTIVVEQNGRELFNQVIQESDAVSVEMPCESCEGGVQNKNVYPIIELPVEDGEITITFPVGAMNFYGFAFNSNGGGQGVENIDATVKAVKSFENGQLVIIKNGVRYNALGAQL